MIRSIRPLLLAGLLALSVALAAAGEARAGVYKCKGPDGKTLYTSDQSQCPGADEHAIRGTVQTVPGNPGRGGRSTTPDASRPPTPPARSARGVAAQDEALAAEWRQKRPQARQSLEAVTGRLEYVRRAIVLCNRGGSLYTQGETGIRGDYSCERVRDEFAELERAESELRAYLEGGLEEECRRSGCLPGWIRE
jgi:hypothetical protein